MKRFICKECPSGPCVMLVPWTPVYCPGFTEQLACWCDENEKYPPEFPSICAIGNWLFLNDELAHVTECTNTYISVVYPYHKDNRPGVLSHIYLNRAQIAGMRARYAIPALLNTDNIKSITRYAAVDIPCGQKLQEQQWTDDTILSAIPSLFAPEVYNYYVRDDHRPLITFVSGATMAC